MGAFVRVTSTADVKPDHGIIAEANGKPSRSVMWMASSMQSTTPVSIGVPDWGRDIEGSVVTCPWHGWQFEIATSACVANPAAKVERYEVLVECADVKVLL